MIMKTEIDFKTLWDKQETIRPSIEELFGQVDRFKKKRLRELVKMNLGLFLTAAFIAFVWYYYQPEWLTTKIGICLVFLAIFIILTNYNRLIPLFIKPGFELNSEQYLQQLVHIKTKELFLQKTIMNLYLGLLLLGICLYMLEYTARMETLWAVVCYTVILLWIGFNWFYLKPKISQKRNAPLNKLISKLQDIEKQFENNQTP